MKNIYAIYKVLLVGLLLSIMLNCKQEVIKTVPAVKVVALTNVTETTAASGGEVLSDGGSMINSRGVCWSTKVNPHLIDSKTTDGKGEGSFTSSLTALLPGATYYLKAYAVNAEGVGYSEQLSFTTKAMLPALTTVAPGAVTINAVSSGGEITNDGGAPVTARGVCWATTENPSLSNSRTTDGSGSGSFTSSITGLASNTTYYIKAYATNSVGTAYGNQVTAKTKSNLPELTTSAISAVEQTTATSGGNITYDGASAITVRGVCWSTSHNPTIADGKSNSGTGTGSFTGNLTGLTPNTTYYVRAYATNSSTTGYGNEVSFKTHIELTPVTDIDGNVYHPIYIGEQVWLVENLKTTKYRNGDPIAKILDNSGWMAATSGAYCSANGDNVNDAAYGLLYNWYAVNDNRKIAPVGYHVASPAEWNTLINYLGGASVAGNKLRETGTVHWDPNVDATNSSGFTALPAGFRHSDDGSYNLFGLYFVFWQATEFDATTANYIVNSGASPIIYPANFNKGLGESVRCIHD